jgi:hypothetical protein
MDAITMVLGLDIKCPMSSVHRKIGKAEQNNEIIKSDKTSCHNSLDSLSEPFSNKLVVGILFMTAVVGSRLIHLDLG